jgi:hypothetical protein
MLLKMVDDTYPNNNMNIRGNANEQYPEVPEEAIVKPEDEKTGYDDKETRRRIVRRRR